MVVERPQRAAKHKAIAMFGMLSENGNETEIGSDVREQTPQKRSRRLRQSHGRVDSDEDDDDIENGDARARRSADAATAVPQSERHSMRSPPVRSSRRLRARDLQQEQEDDQDDHENDDIIHVTENNENENENLHSHRYPKRARRPYHFGEALRENNDDDYRGKLRRNVNVEIVEEEEEEEEEEDDDDEEPVRLPHRYPKRDRRQIVDRLQYTHPSPTEERRVSDRKKRAGGGGGGPGGSNYLDRVDSWMKRFRQDDSDCEVSDRGLGGTTLGGPGVVWRPDVPLNVIESGLAGVGGANTAGKKNGGSSEITAIQVDTNITWDMVGGLGEYIKAIKEMVFLPLVYPEVFSRFHIAPPRGLLLFGPPGTGKTLLARALAASASRAGKAVSFFMRKGADVLSKWVGESEKQLRMLFEEAQKQQPSIIFFDEIDGLAPLRNGKQDQIHNSIVSTLLALMDGLDSRGQVIVIGATNRIDAIDSALRRPGRFDREFMVPLPTVEARESILKIHTRKWTEQPAPLHLKRLAEECVGYSGADLKALCTEAAIRSLRRCYPQIYEREERLLIDASTIKVEEKDFDIARRGITPAAHRSAVQHARPIPSRIEPCLQSTMSCILREVTKVFPISRPCIEVYKESMSKKSSQSVDVRFKEEKALEENGVPTSSECIRAESIQKEENEDNLFEPDEALHLWAMIAEGSRIPCAASRLLITGPDGFGQQYLGSAVLHALEGFPCHSLGLPTLLADDSARSPEEALVRRITEARRSAPAVLFLPHLQLWWQAAHSNLRVTLWMLLEDIPPDLPLFLLATADVSDVDVDPAALDLFGENVYELQFPSRSDRRLYFQRIRETMMTKPVKTRKKKRVIEDLPLAPPLEPRAPTEHELRLQAASEEASVRSLRMFLREKVLLKLLNDRKWTPFVRPLHLAYPDTDFSFPMDLSTMLWNLDEGKYPTLNLFRKDIHAIVNAMEEFVSYDRERVEAARVVSRARALEDTVEVLLTGCDQSLVQKCDEIESRGGPLKTGKQETKSKSNPITKPSYCSRFRGNKIEKDVVFQDPEQVRREILEQKKAAQAAETAGVDEEEVKLELYGNGAQDSEKSIEDNAEQTSDCTELPWPPLGMEEASFQWLDEAVRYSDGFSIRTMERLYGYMCRELEHSRAQHGTLKDGSNIVTFMKTTINYINKLKETHEKRT